MNEEDEKMSPNGIEDWIENDESDYQIQRKRDVRGVWDGTEASGWVRLYARKDDIYGRLPGHCKGDFGDDEG